MSHQSLDQSWSIERLLRAFWRFRGRALLVCVAVMLAAIAAIFLLPKEYDSEAKIFVRVGRENVALDPTITKQEVIGLTTTRDIEINSILEHLRSRAIAERVALSLQPELSELSPLDRDQAIRKLEKRVFIETPKASAVVVLHCESLDPLEAQQTLAKYIEVFLSEHMRVNHSKGSRNFFTEQIEQLSQQIEEARAKLRDAKTKAGMASLEGQRTSVELQISNSEASIARIKASISANDAKVAALATALDRIPEPLLGQLVAGTPNDGMAMMRHSLFDLQSKEKEILSKVSQGHPSAMAIREQVSGVEQALHKSTADRSEVENAVMMRETADAKGLSAELKTVEGQLAALQDRLKILNDNEGGISTLDSELKRKEARYQIYVEHLEEARMEEALHADQITNVNLLQPATFVATPIRPKKSVVLVLALATAMLCSAGVVLLADSTAPKSVPAYEVVRVGRPMGTQVAH